MKRNLQFERRNAFQESSRQSGVGMLSALLSVFFLGVIVIVVMKTMGTSLDSSALSKSINNISVIRQTLFESIDCVETLGISEHQPLPLSCASYGNVVLKNSEGEAFTEVGEWQIRAGCRNNEIIVRAGRPGENRLNKRPWNDYRLSGGIPVSQDLFGGVPGSKKITQGGLSEICRSYFDGSMCNLYKRNKILYQGKNTWELPPRWNIPKGTGKFVPDIVGSVPNPGVYRVFYRIDGADMFVDTPAQVSNINVKVVKNRNLTSGIAEGDWFVSQNQFGFSAYGEDTVYLEKSDRLEIYIETTPEVEAHINTIDMTIVWVDCNFQ